MQFGVEPNAFASSYVRTYFRPDRSLRLAHVGVTRMESRQGDKLKYQHEFMTMLSPLWLAIKDLPPGENILVFCKEGKHRSAFLVAGMLMGVSGVSHDTVCSYLRRLRKIVDFDTEKDDRHFSGYQALARSKQIWTAFGDYLGYCCELPQTVSASAFELKLADQMRLMGVGHCNSGTYTSASHVHSKGALTFVYSHCV